MAEPDPTPTEEDGPLRDLHDMRASINRDLQSALASFGESILRVVNNRFDDMEAEMSELRDALKVRQGKDALGTAGDSP